MTGGHQHAVGGSAGRTEHDGLAAGRRVDAYVAAFTETYFPTVNGVTYTLDSWRREWERRGGRMDVVYPSNGDYEPADGEHAVRSLRFPFYDEFRLGLPSVPDAVADADIVHTHGPFSLGIAGLRLARRNGASVVATYHTPTHQYAEYLAFTDALTPVIESAAERYERRFYDQTDLVLAPSATIESYLREELGVETPVEIVPNGVETELFQPVDAGSFRAEHGLGRGSGTSGGDGKRGDGRPLVGYTGRHGFEKHLDELLRAAADLDVRVVLGGDGPARDHLEGLADDLDVDATFLGYLPREQLPALYSALDAFVFPSRNETQGLVALEANACGTPVVGADAGALRETVVADETGYRYEPGDIDDLRRQIRRVLEDRGRLSEACLARREDISVAAAVDRLAAAYDSLDD